jgi:hypothetical protein
MVATLALLLSLSPPVIDTATAARYFAEARALAQRDGGATWGRSLEGPMIFLDPATRRVVASAPDAEGRLVADGAVFTGTLPPEVPASNTALEWAGVRWTVVVWPLPADERARGQLMAHELFHRIQGDLGIPMASPKNEHLDTLDGRYWLRLEWRALAAALDARGEERARAVADALAFRAARRAAFPGATAEERALELNEGLAEYTGVALASTTPEARAAVARATIDGAAKRPTFVRSFAYVSGPAYGLLLDAASPGWRRGLSTSSDLGDLAAAAYGARATAAEGRAARYGGPELLAEERERDRARRERIATYRARLVDGPALRLPAGDVKFSFDPNEVVPLGSEGTVYPTIRAAGPWGVLTATKGALIASDWSALTVAAPAAGDLLRGDGWTLELAPGWRVVPAAPGSFTVGR